MIDLRLLRNDPDRVAENCRNRGLDLDIPRLLKLDEQVREAQAELERIRQRRNEISGQMKGPMPQAERQPLIEESKALRSGEQSQEERFRTLEEERNKLFGQVPNFTHPDSPLGATDEDNQPFRQVGEPRKFDFEPKDHVELMEALDLIDFEGGAKVAGQKFYYLKNQAAFLELEP